MEFTQSRDLLDKARGGTAGTRDELYKLKQKLANVRREKDQLSRGFDTENAAHRRRLQALQEQEQALVTSIKDKTGKLKMDVAAELGRLKDFLTFTDPRANLLKLDDAFPILLLPLRLETRFKQVTVGGRTATKPQLWIRVFPDDVAIDSFESILSKDELRNAKSYWQAMWRAADVEVEQRGAWRSLVASHGSGRAYWITKNYIPMNPSEQPTQKDPKEVILVIGTEKPLALTEKPIVEQFWEAMWRSVDDSEKQTQAQQDLIDRLSEARAEEIMTLYAPFNLADKPPADTDHTTAKVTVVFVEFPDSDALNTKLQSWSVPPMVNVLPERLVIQGFYQNNMELNIIGSPIPSSLIVGPDPSVEEGTDLNLQGDDLVVSEDMKWLTDFNEAVDKGMGFKIDLTAVQAQRGFDRLLVLGIRMSADKSKGQQLLEDLFEHHHHSRKGLSILRQGTPTNNTEKVPSGYLWQEDADISFDHYFVKEDSDETLQAWTRRSDGQWLAECLGVDSTKIVAIDNFTATGHTDAKAMNIALWPATLGYFMESMMAPVFDDEIIRQAHEFFIHNVSGRGLLPAICIGNQPYGILPTTTFSRMNWLRSIDIDLTHRATAAPHDPDSPFLLKLYTVLLEIDKTWSELRNRVAYVGKRGDAHQILLDIIGLHPNSVEVHSRYAQSLEHLHNYYNLIGLPLSRSNKFSVAKYIQSGLQLLEKFGYHADTKRGIPDILSKFFFGKTDRLTGKLIDDAPLSETEKLRAHTTTNKNYIEWLIEAVKTSHDALRRQHGFINDAPPAALLYLLLHHALDLSYIDSSLRLHESRGLMTKDAVTAARIEPRFIHIEQETDKGSRWRYLYKREAAITGSDTMLISEYIPTIFAEAKETRDLTEMLEALGHLQERPTAALERVLIEHLDICAYRYDAWMLGLVNYQLQHMRKITGDKGAAMQQGIFLGAYGWLEEVRPKDRQLEAVRLDGELRLKFQRKGDAPLVKDSSNAGYILAPSLSHAVTAAVLRDGYISNRTSTSAKPFAINLSSERVRLALNIIGGMRAGQSLAALLGYQLERGLHDRHDTEVDEFIYDLRLAFPLQANQMRSTRTDEATSIEQIEARNVINGLALIEHIEKTGVPNYPFNIDLPPATSEQRTAIDAEVQRIIEINDAVADLAMAEGVHQVVQGNYDRAAAVLDSYSKGHLPPTPDVVQTPRSGVTITHRVGLQFRAELPANPAFTTPRSKAEPALNDWLTSVLPAAGDTVCVIEYFDNNTAAMKEETISIADLQLQPIDLLYLVNTGNEQAMSALDDIIHRYIINTFAPRPDAAITILYTRAVENKITLFELAPLIDSLRALVLQSRPLNVSDTKPAIEAKKTEEGALILDPQRITVLMDELSAIVSPPLPAVSPLQDFIDAISPLIAAEDIDGLITSIDTFIDDLSGIFADVGRFGLQQTGTGFLYDWRRRTFSILMGKVGALATRLQERLTEYDYLLTQYTGTTTPEEKYALLQRAERLIATTSTVPLPPPDNYRDILQNIKRPAYEAQLNRIQGLRVKTTISTLFQGIAAEQATLGDFDLVGIDITDERKQILVFVDDMKVGAENLQKDIMQRLDDVQELLVEHGSTTSATKRVQLISDAAKKLLHEDFKLIPEFSLTRTQADEWHNAMNDSDNLLRYLHMDKALDFPVDDWVYGMARVREKLHHLENATFLVEGLTASNLELRAVQFPYRQHDYWLALPYPDTIAETNEPFVIEEDKLLYTAIYAGSFDKDKRQCGLLLDEWTEVIPVPEATTGLTFHFDQPNTEPPQTLLLVTPSEFRGAWQWQDLVDTLQETLEMAKKRAVEPDQIDTTAYGRFLPALVSVVTAFPITAALKLAINNKYYLKVADHG
jgi:hypothetical protein